MEVKIIVQENKETSRIRVRIEEDPGVNDGANNLEKSFMRYVLDKTQEAVDAAMDNKKIVWARPKIVEELDKLELYIKHRLESGIDKNSPLIKRLEGKRDALKLVIGEASMCAVSQETGDENHDEV